MPYREYHLSSEKQDFASLRKITSEADEGGLKGKDENSSLYIRSAKVLQRICRVFLAEFFDMPNHEVDVFIHAWDEVGYTPSDDINETNECNSTDQLKDEIWNTYGGNEGKIKHIVVESPKEKFNKIADSFSEVINQVRDDRFYEEQDWRKSVGRKKIKGVPDEITDCTSVRIGSGKVLRYTGQFYSIGKSRTKSFMMKNKTTSNTI